MSREFKMTQTEHGSYVQLNTFDEKENDFVQLKSSYPSLIPYHRCLCTKRDTIIVLIVSVLVCILVTVSLAIGLPKIQDRRAAYLDVSFPESSSPLLSFGKAVVLVDGGPCASIGKEVLSDGGSAVDAAIAALFCDGVVNPHCMGLGGGFLMTIYDRLSRTSTVIDAREVAPKNASRDMFHGNASLSEIGGLSIAVPGELRGYWAAHQKFGKLPWKQLIEPAIQLCTHGFVVSAHLADKLQLKKKYILENEILRKEFFNNQTNDVYREGDVLKRPILGITLNEIAAKGADVLYTGDLHQSFVEDIQACGGIVNEADMSDYKPEVKEAAQVPLESQSLTLHTVPPPGSGLILGLILNMLSNYNMSSRDFEDLDSAVLQYHRMAEVFKFAFSQRTYLGDSAFVNISELESKLKTKAFADSLQQKISDEMTHPIAFYKPVSEVIEDEGTAHLSVIAENGDAVSVTSTLNSYLGSLCISPSTGIILNNAMDDFSSPNITNSFGLPPSPANFIAPNKRPLSSMSPTIAVDSAGNVKMVTGATGGTRIITASALGILRSLWLGEDIKQATDAPRIHHQLSPNAIQYETTFPKIYLDKLKAYGHDYQENTFASAFFGIIRNGGKYETNFDHRRGGSASGY